MKSCHYQNYISMIHMYIIREQCNVFFLINFQRKSKVKKKGMTHYMTSTDSQQMYFKNRRIRNL